jgi:hypothetical protein
MTIYEHFSNTYTEARTKFLSAAEAAGAKLAHHVLPPTCRGSKNEELGCDVASLGASNAKSLLVLISGTHGVEGFCGSGCQVGYLADRLDQALSPESAVVLIHAINPFGFSWLRRVNEDSVDLNRNFHKFSDPLPSSQSYEALHDWLMPSDWEGEPRARADAALQGYIAKKGLMALQAEIAGGQYTPELRYVAKKGLRAVQAEITEGQSNTELREYIAKRGFRVVQAEITGGQYTRPNGLFYGGSKATWSNQILRQILSSHVTPTIKRLAVIDFHTGLGEPGFGEPIYVGRTTEEYELAKTWYGQEVKNLSEGEAVATALSGSVANALPSATSDRQSIYLALEFGTAPPSVVLDALRADHWLHVIPERVTHLRNQIKRQIRDAFYLDAPWWKVAVYGRAIDFIMRGTRALQNSAS